MTAKFRVLICDDSQFMRAAVRKLLERDGRFEVIGEARDGQDAIDKVLALGPDVCTMDFNMPILDGAHAVREIMKQKPTPVVMLSAHTKQGAKETFDALAAGAVDFVTKPSGEVSTDLSSVAGPLIGKILSACDARPMPVAELPPPRTTSTRLSVANINMNVPPRVAVIAVSTGGPAALARVLPAFPRDTSLAIIVVQHLPAGFTAPLAERLDSLSQIRVREGAAGNRPEAGLALIAPGNMHLEFEHDGALRIFDAPEVNGVRPAADLTMKSAATVFGRRCIGVVMTGMGRDGADGCKAIKAVGGSTVAQDQSTSVIWGMPRAALESGCIDRVVPIDSLADAIRQS